MWPTVSDRRHRNLGKKSLDAQRPPAQAGGLSWLEEWEFEDVKPKIAEQPKTGSDPSCDDQFQADLLDYSRAIVKSTIDHCPEKAQSLADSIASARDKVIASHKRTVKGLRLYISVGEEQIRQLKEANAIHEQASFDRGRKEMEELRRYSTLRQEMLAERSEKERRKRSWDEAAWMREEHEDMKEEKKRKRQSAVDIWEKAEKAELDT